MRETLRFRMGPGRKRRDTRFILGCATPEQVTYTERKKLFWSYFTVDGDRNEVTRLRFMLRKLNLIDLVR